MANLQKEIWIDQLMENYYVDSSFLSHAKDFSALVDYDAINMAEAGVDPEVLINNTTYPITSVQRVDKPLRMELDLFETINTLVRYPEVIEYSYDQLESVLRGHRNTLRAKTSEKAAHAHAPNEDSTYTPTILTTGQSYNGRKRLVPEDILALKERFDSVDLPLENRYLVLHPSHLTDLIVYDMQAFKDITDFVDGRPKRFAGFNILQFSKPAYYDISTMKKLPYGAAGVNFCSFAFHSDEVMKADGDVKMYVRYDDPEERGTLVGFDKRFIAVPIRNKGIGSIVSDNA